MGNHVFWFGRVTSKFAGVNQQTCTNRLLCGIRYQEGSGGKTLRKQCPSPTMSPSFVSCTWHKSRRFRSGAQDRFLILLQWTFIRFVLNHSPPFLQIEVCLRYLKRHSEWIAVTEAFSPELRLHQGLVALRHSFIKFRCHRRH